MLYLWTKHAIMKFNWRRIAVWGLSLLGMPMVSCFREMYGVPYDSYTIDVTVTDEDGIPIKDIEVADEYNNAVKTDADGKTTVYQHDFQDWKFEVRDVDGPENGGEFESAEITEETLEIVKKPKSKNGWGVSIQAKADIQLKKK